MRNNKKEKSTVDARTKAVRILKRLFVDNALVKILAIVVSVALWLVIGYLFRNEKPKIKKFNKEKILK